MCKSETLDDIQVELKLEGKDNLETGMEKDTYCESIYKVSVELPVWGKRQKVWCGTEMPNCCIPLLVIDDCKYPRYRSPAVA